MKKLFINIATKNIEISEAFSKKAGNFGSPEYKNLKEAREAYPDFTIKVIKAKKSKDSTFVKGITCEFMYNYASTHETERSVVEFAQLEKDASFLAVRKAFLNSYPQFKELKTCVEWHLAARA